MRKEINTWYGFKPGDVVVEVTSGPGPVVVERQAPRFALGMAATATVRGVPDVRVLRCENPEAGYAYWISAWIVNGNRKHYDSDVTDVSPDPDWRAAVDAYARQNDRLRRVVGSTPDGALRQALEQLLTSVQKP